MNIKKVRKETPATKKIIHFNNAGASLMPQTVLNKIQKYYKEEGRLGGYETALKYNTELKEFYINAAKLLNCSSCEIAFVENATRAWDMAIYSIPFSSGDKIITSMYEYGSNVISYLHLKKLYGIEICYIPNNQSGTIDLDMLEKNIDNKVKLIAITHMPTGSGVINPAEKIGAIAKKYNITYLLDACQSVGQISIDVKKIQCDILSVTGRKYIRGPRGTGFLYVNKKILKNLEPPILDQHSALLISEKKYEILETAQRFETWEQNCAAKIGLSTAIKYLLSIGIENIQNRNNMLANYLREKLKTINGIEVIDLGEKKSAIVSFKTHLNIDTLYQYLLKNNINTCISRGAGSLIDFKARNIEEALRCSIHYYNTKHEINIFIKILKQIHYQDQDI